MITRNKEKMQRNWKKDLADVVTDPSELFSLLKLDTDKLTEHYSARKLFAVRVPRPFIKLMEPGNLNDPLLKQVMPHNDEFIDVPGFSPDPLQEQKNAAPGLLHKYKSRVLLILKGGCAINCRYCFRRHFPYAENSLNKAQLLTALDYIKQDKRINEVILSGGDPLMATDEALAWLVTELAKIGHLLRIRIHSRLPVVIPARLTPELVTVLTQTRLKAIMVYHINHANEISPEFMQLNQPFANAGITLLNQAVLLKGINDNAETLCQLSEKLFTANVMPYYLHLLDKVKGAAHFDVSELEARKIMQQVYRDLPGFLVPKLTRELPNQQSKTPIDLDF